MSTRFVLGVTASVLAGALPVSAAPVLFSGSSGGLAASALFDTSGSNLIVTLTNTSTSDVLAPSDVLTGMFFSVGGASLSLGRVGAILGPGSSVVFGGSDPGGVVGGEWAFLGGLLGAPGGAAYGISSSGLGLFGPGNLFPGSNLQGPADPDGLQYGIIPTIDNLGTGNGAVTGSNALIRNQVVFTLSGLPDGFNPATRITACSFQYGTALTEPNVPGSPAPGGLAVLTAAGLWAPRRRRRTPARSAGQ